MGANDGRLSYAVGSENDVSGLQETGAEHVAKGVILLAEGEDASRGQA